MHWPEEGFKSAVKPAFRQELTIKTIKQGEPFNVFSQNPAFSPRQSDLQIPNRYHVEMDRFSVQCIQQREMTVSMKRNS